MELDEQSYKLKLLKELEIKQELEKRKRVERNKNNFKDFEKDQLRIITKDASQGYVEFEFNEAQTKIHKAIEKQIKEKGRVRALVLKARQQGISTYTAGRVFWNLLIASLVMLIAGYVGEVGYVNVWLAFVVGMLGWTYILYAIFAGDAQENLSSAPEGVQSAFNTMRLIVLVGWAIYPLGYVLGYAGETIDAGTLNGIYNIADFVNKILFGLIIWHVAVKESASA